MKVIIQEFQFCWYITKGKNNFSFYAKIYRNAKRSISRWFEKKRPDCILQSSLAYLKSHISKNIRVIIVAEIVFYLSIIICILKHFLYCQYKKKKKFCHLLDNKWKTLNEGHNRIERKLKEIFKNKRNI